MRKIEQAMHKLIEIVLFIVIASVLGAMFATALLGV